MRKILFLLALCLATAAQAYNVTVKAYFHEAPTDKVCTAEHLSAYNVFLLNAEETGSTDLKTAAKNIAQNLDELIASHPTTLYDTEYDYEYEQYGLKFDTTQDDGAMFLVITYGEGDKRYLYVGTRKITEYDDEKTDITLNIDDDSQSFTKWALASSYNAPDDGSLELEVYLYTMPANGDTAPATANASNYQYTVVDAEEVGTTDFDEAVEYIGKNIDALFLANPTEEVESPYYYKGWQQYIFQFTCKVAGEGKKFVVVKYNDSEYYVGAFTADKYETDPEIDDSYGYLFSDWMPLSSNTPTGTIELKATDGTDYYATFSSDLPVKFKDATVYAVSVSGTSLQLKEITSKEVPANTGVLVKATNTTAEYDYVSSAAAVVDNMLRPASETMTGDYKFYKLAYDDSTMEPASLGFYYGAADGAAFTSREGSAYLAVPAAAAAKGYSFVADDATGIKEIQNAEFRMQNYNLNGVRVNKSYKGIVIVNGKKMLNK